MIVIVPIHNQAKNFMWTLPGYMNQAQMPEHIVFVLDRCVDLSAKLLTDATPAFAAKGTQVHIVDTAASDLRGFGAGRTRDVGITYAIENNLGDEFLFVDGDCVPSPRLVEQHAAQLQVRNPRVTCGLRYETVPAGTAPTFSVIPGVLPQQTVQDDLRLEAPWCLTKVFGVTYDRLVRDPQVLTQSWICWSCNLGMNRAAIDLCRYVNGALSGDENRVFCSEFDGRWGGEDGYVGLTMFRCGGEIVALSSRSYVTHLWHERKHTNIDHLRTVNAKDATLLATLNDRRIEPYACTTVEGPIQPQLGKFDVNTFSAITDYEADYSTARIIRMLDDDPYLSMATITLLSGYLRYQSAHSAGVFTNLTPQRDQCELAAHTVLCMGIRVEGDRYYLASPLNYKTTGGDVL